MGNEHHRWRFARVGGFDQVCIETAADLLALDQLDQKLWAALSCPTRGLEFDARTLELIDTDRDGHIRAPDVLEAVRWTCSVLKDPGTILAGAPELLLSNINSRSPAGAKLLACARQILVSLGKSDATAISVDDTADSTRILGQTRFNGDGIVPADAANDEPTRTAIAQIIECMGAEVDANGKPGVSQAKADAFFAEARAYSDWWSKAEGDPRVMPLGASTPAAAAAYAAVKAKVDDFFARCRLAAFDSRARAAVNPAESDYAALASKLLTDSAEDVAALPLARVKPKGALPLGEGINPAWADAMARLNADAVKPILGKRSRLTPKDWQALGDRLAPYAAWQAAKRGAAVERLSLTRVRDLLAGPERDALAALIAKDASVTLQARAMADVEKLVRYHRDLRALLNNFVAFHDFYNRSVKAVFQAGSLYLDGRSCDLCVRVEDMNRHSALAGISRCYLAYCDCVRRGGSERMTIVAAFTGGNSEFLMVGRNGVFYDRDGRDWDATIVKVFENPIGMRQAFWAPYRRVAKFVEEQIGKIAAARDQATTDRMGIALVQTGTAPQEAKGAVAQTFDVARFAGIFAAIGLAVGAIGTALTAVIKGFLGLTLWQMPLAVAVVLLLISGPSMLLAYLKLRQRNLGPILEANGWAVNGRLRINLPFGRSLTAVASLPEGAERSFLDPYAEKRNLWPWAIAVLVALILVAYGLNEHGLLYRWIGVGRRVEAQQNDSGQQAAGSERR